MTKLKKLFQSAFTRTNLYHLALAMASVLMYSALFPPVEWGILGFVALVPWLVVVSRTTGRAQAIISYLAGLAFYLLNVWWISPITIPGYISMSLYLAVYFPLAGFLIQRLNRRWSVPLVWAAPLAWVSVEFIRSQTVLGFPWFYLGHSQATLPRVIQIADLGGAYLVSFALALINGALAALWAHGLRRAAWSLVTAGLALAFTLGYGTFRLNQATLTTGPTVAVVQDDFPMFVDDGGVKVTEMFNSYQRMSEQTFADKPNLIVWPETCIGSPVNPDFLSAHATDEDDRIEQQYGQMFSVNLIEHAVQADSYLIVGSLSRRINPPGHYPRVDKYNSALIFDNQGRYIDRYDKIRLVLFGEVVPFRYTWPRLYWFLNENMTPYGKGGFEYSLTPGTERKRFALPTKQGNFRYSIAICYEDTMSDLVAQFVDPADGKKQIDFLINISNDGWFGHSAELLQHFYIGVFRAVENRIAIARSVNTGISGFINPDGSIAAMLTDGSRIYGPGIRGSLTRPIKIDSRVSLYSYLGNWPAGILTLTVLLLALALPLVVKSKTN